jgi:hypothetical protein
MTSASKVSLKTVKCIRSLVLIADIALAENRLPRAVDDHGAPLLVPGTARPNWNVCRVGQRKAPSQPRPSSARE